MKYWKRINGKVLFDEPLSEHTTFRIGGPCRVWVEPSDEADLREVLELANSKKKEVFVIGNGSNILANDAGFKGVIVRLGSDKFRRVRFEGRMVIAGAGILLEHLISIACRKGYGGIEGLVGIPASLGGAISTNASYAGGISDCLESVRVMDRSNGKIKVIKRKNLKFAYRHSSLKGYIILQATLKLMKSSEKSLLERRNILLAVKKNEQPLERRSAGCIFKNPRGRISAAQYIDMLGFRGYRIGGAEISEKHANFIINLKGAKAKDVLRLMDLVKRRVKLSFGVDLVPEIEIL